MRLLKKNILLAVAVTLLVTITLDLVLYFTIIYGFNRLEDKIVEQNVIRINNSLENYFSYLLAKSGDWAHWDETYHFVDDLNPEFIHENLVQDAFQTLDVNFAVFINKEGKIVEQYALDLVTKREDTIPQELLDKLILISKDLNKGLESSSTYNYALIPGKNPLLYVGHGIVRSDGSGPVNGTLFFGRYLDEKVMASIEKNTIFPIALKSLNDPSLPEDFREAAHQLMNGSQSFIISRHQDDVYAYVLIRDFQNQPSFLFKVTIPREIHKQGKVTILYVLTAVGVAGLLFALTIFLFSRILEGKQHEDFLEKYTEELEKLNKLKSEFVAIASHQLRTPLTSVKWFTELLISDPAGTLSSIQKDYISQICVSNERMIRLVNNLLLVSNIDKNGEVQIELKKEQTDLMAILKNVISEQVTLAKMKNVEIIFSNKLEESLLLVLDREKLKQVLRTLLENAVKYSLAKTSIHIECQNQSGSLVTSIIDLGIGILKEEQNRVFEKFFRGRNVSKIDSDGAGLNLFIAKAIVVAHGGRIWFESEENKGTTFHFSIPII